MRTEGMNTGSDQYDAILERCRLSSKASDALHSIQMSLMKISSADSPKLNENARKYLMQGVLNRYLSIEEDWRWIRFNLPIDRKQPLTTNKGRLASLHLNSLYLHTLGVLDNFAWLFLLQLEPELANSIRRNQVSLYSEKVLKLLPDGPEKNNLIGFSKWYRDMCEKRHPIAHRLPLRIPSQILRSSEEVEQRQILDSQYHENNNKFLQELKEVLSDDPGDLDIHGLNRHNQLVQERNKEHKKRQREIEQEIEELGTFIPGFMYPEEDILYPIYPTVAEDVKNLDIIVNECLSIIHKICS